jgi:hypothetical protein
MNKYIYNFDNNKIFTNISSAMYDPIESKKQRKDVLQKLDVNKATYEPIPDIELAEGYSWQFDGKWSQVRDVSKINWYNKLTLKKKQFNFGETIPDDYTDSVPIEKQQFQKCDETTKKFIVDLESELDYLKTIKKQWIRQFTEKEITSGFIFNGSLYDSELEDQFNIFTLTLAGGEIKSKNIETGEREWELYTAEQVLDLVEAFTVHKTTILKKATTKYNEIESAQNKTELEAIQW